jgi:hypothetical protein
VAVAAVDAESGDVMLVAEGDGLGLADSGIGDVGGTLDFHGHPAERSNDEHRAKNGGAGQGVRTAMKNLRHSVVRSCLRDPGYWRMKTSSELALELEIINSSPEFVADFVFRKRKKIKLDTGEKLL